VSIKLKYPLAFNLDGEEVRIPSNARAWRVRRIENGSLAYRRGGECNVVNGPDGGPLYVSLGRPIGSLSAYLVRGGLYRLDAVSESLRVLRDVSVFAQAASQVAKTVDGDGAPAVALTVTSHASRLIAAKNLLVERAKVRS
jgi:hypothetical protein